MKSSLVIEPGCVQSESLPGSVTRPDVGPFAHDFLLRRAARLARPRREDDARDDRFGDRLVVIQPVLERRPHHAVHRRQHLGIVQTILRLPLKLRLLNEDRQDAGHALADVLGRERHAFRREVVRLDVVAHRLAEARRASRSRACRPSRSGCR